jgi:methionyl aminopeptidase
MLVKTKEEIKKLIELGKRHKEVLLVLEHTIRTGVTTDELEKIALREIEKQGARPAFKNYRPVGAPFAFPCALCVAPNDIVVHGIPTKLSYTLQEGDIIGLDIGLEKDGLFTDAGYTVPVGVVDETAQALLSATQKALDAGVAVARAGGFVGDIGCAIEESARASGFGLVRDLCGHGVGHAVHEEPQIPNYGEKGKGMRLKEGMVLAIEPMLNEGSGKVDFMKDWYTVRTHDGKRSAHFEHDIVIRDGEPLVLV